MSRLASFQFGSPAAADVLSRGAERVSNESLARQAAIQQMIGKAVDTWASQQAQDKQLDYQTQKDIEDRAQAELERQNARGIIDAQQSGETGRTAMTTKSAEQIAADDRKVRELLGQLDYDASRYGTDASRDVGMANVGADIYRTDANTNLGFANIASEERQGEANRGLTGRLADADRVSREGMQEKSIAAQREIQSLVNTSDILRATMANDTTRRGQDMNQEIAKIDLFLKEKGIDKQFEAAIMDNDMEKYKAILNGLVQLEIVDREQATRMYGAATERMKAVADIKNQAEVLKLNKWQMPIDNAIKFGQLNQQKYATDMGVKTDMARIGAGQSAAETEAATARAPEILDTVSTGNFGKVYPAYDQSGRGQLLEAQISDNTAKARAALSKAFDNEKLSAGELNTVLSVATKQLDIAGKDMTPQQLAAYEELVSLKKLAESRSGALGGSTISGEQAAMVKDQMYRLLDIIGGGSVEGGMPQLGDMGLEKPGFVRDLFDPFTPKQEDETFMGGLLKRAIRAPVGGAIDAYKSLR